MKVDYDRVAPTYDHRYEQQRYAGIANDLRARIQPGFRVLEVGCGTGHWLSLAASTGALPVGLDPSAEMLRKAVGKGHAVVARAMAACLPVAPGSFDLVMVINAAHHFGSVHAFVEEAHRVLRPGGQLAVFGLDPRYPGTGWFIYDYFESTRAVDEARYPSAQLLRDTFTSVGFDDVTTRVSCAIQYEEPALEFLARSAEAKQATSQLILLSDAEYGAGLQRIQGAMERAIHADQPLMLSADLSILGTFGSKRVS